jgi:hypothetical protein
MTFKDNKYLVVRDVISKDTLSLIKYQSNMLEDVMCYNNNTLPKLFAFGDPQTSNSFSYYGSLFTESLLLLLKPIMEQHLGIELFPTYSYMRIYYKDAVLDRHTDRPSCEYSATLCIQCDPSAPWPIYFHSNGTDTSLLLNEGDICIYKGDELPHWRDACLYDNHIQVFLHFVDKNGQYCDFKYDKRSRLGILK